jgi:hypothetical protein
MLRYAVPYFMPNNKSLQILRYAVLFDTKVQIVMNKITHCDSEKDSLIL